MTTKTKIRALEDHVLPEYPEPAVIYISDEREIALSVKAQKIRKGVEAGTANILQNENLTLEQKIEKGQKIYDELGVIEQNIITKDSEFMRQRLRSILEGYYMPMFPKNNTAVRLRIAWFLREMDKLSYYEQLEESEFNFNRNEDAPEFNDVVWWDNFNVKAKELFPDGVFTEESFAKLRNWFDIEEGKFMVQYWKEHPEEYKLAIKEMEKQVKDAKA